MHDELARGNDRLTLLVSILLRTIIIFFPSKEVVAYIILLFLFDTIWISWRLPSKEVFRPIKKRIESN